MASVRSLPNVPAFPAYIFDIDGTLLDSAADICGTVQQVLLGHVPEPLPISYLRGFIGFHLDAVFMKHLPDYTRAQYDQLIADYRAMYLARKHAATGVYPGVAEALAALPGRKSTATTKGTPTSRAILEQFGLLPYFDQVQGTDGFPAKPAPDVVLHSMQGLGARPEECLMIGDSPADIEAARAAGVKICAVTYGYGDREEIARLQPDYMIDDLRELLPVPA